MTNEDPVVSAERTPAPSGVVVSLEAARRRRGLGPSARAVIVAPTTAVPQRGSMQALKRMATGGVMWALGMLMGLAPLA